MPDISTVAKNLKFKYEDTAKERWRSYVAAVLSIHDVALNAPPFVREGGVLFKVTPQEVVDFVQNYDTEQQVLNRLSVVKLDKKDFSWSLPLNDYSPIHAAQNARLQYEHYRGLAELAGQIEANRSNHNEVLELVAEIKNKKTTVPSIIPPLNGGKPNYMYIQEGISPTTGNNVIEDFFFKGVFAVLSSPVLAISSIFYGAGSLLLCNKLYYFGTLTFLRDMITQFVTGLLEITAAVVFPIGMLYSKATTGSYNIFRGERLRALDSLEEMCGKQEEYSAVAP